MRWENSKNYRDAVVIGVSNDLVFDLFPSLEASVNEDLIIVRECFLRNLDEFIAVICKTGTKSAEGVTCT